MPTVEWPRTATERLAAALGIGVAAHVRTYAIMHEAAARGNAELYYAMDEAWHGHKHAQKRVDTLLKTEY